MNESMVIISRLSESFFLNVQLFGATLLFSLPLGLVIAFGAMSKFKPLAWLVNGVVWVVRGTPLMLQVMVVFFGPGLMDIGNPWTVSGGRFMAAIVAFSFNYACYFSEIFRGGIQGIPRGQTEAGQVLGLTRPQIFFKITLPQLTKRILPPMGNEVITLVKDTSLANVIANLDVILTAKEYTSAGLIWPLFFTAIYFLVFVGILTIVFGLLERKLDYIKA